jgi:hypothetical protein
MNSSLESADPSYESCKALKQLHESLTQREIVL